MNFKHGKAKTRLHTTWLGMRSRCENPNNPAYKNYGGRGITVCARWSDFVNFCADMGEPPSGLTLERKENDAGYSPENCIWGTRKQQNRNRRGLVQITIEGETQPLAVWIERIGVVSYGTAHRRISVGWDAEDAIKTPKITRRKGIPRGARITGFDADQMIETPAGAVPLWKAIEASGLKIECVMRRIKRGWPIAQAIALSPRRGPRKEAFHDQESAAA